MPYLPALTLILAPAYAIKLFGSPINLLMVWVTVVCLVVATWAITSGQEAKMLFFRLWPEKPMGLLTVVFFGAGLAAWAKASFSQESTGQFIVLIAQPLIMFLLARHVFLQKPEAIRFFRLAAYVMMALAGAIAVIQYFTLLGLPDLWQGNQQEPKRSLAFFVHPNFYALFSAPLMAWLLPDLWSKMKHWRHQQNWMYVFFWLTGLAGLFLSLSRAGWLGLAAAAAAFLLATKDKGAKKAAAAAAAILVVIILNTPNLRWRIALPFYGEKSSVSRLSLWDTGWKAVKEQPLTGLGLKGFANNWDRLNSDPNLDRHNFPHNIFLNFWVETGFFGLLAFVGIASWHLWRGFSQKTNNIALATALFFTAMIVQGMIDNPYLKNDLALEFWLVVAAAQAWQKNG